VERYEEPLVRYAARTTGGLDRAHDVVQETFLLLCQQERSKVEDHLAQWLFSVCRNTARAYVRREGRAGAFAGDRLGRQESTEPSPQEALADGESEAEVLRLLSVLSESQQEVIRLKYEHGLSYRDIGRVTGLSESNVGVLIHRGLRRLRKEYGKLNHEAKP